MFNITIRNSNSSKSCKTFYFCLQIEHFCLQICLPYCTAKYNNNYWQIWRRIICNKLCRIINKIAANAKDQKDCCCQQFPNHHQNFHLLAILLLQSDTSLIPLWKHKVITRIRSKGWENQVMSHDRSPAFLRSQSMGHFWRGKCSLWGAKIWNAFLGIDQGYRLIFNAQN